MIGDDTALTYFKIEPIGEITLKQKVLPDSLETYKVKIESTGNITLKRCVLSDY